MTTGEKIAKLRKEYNYTQESLGDELGVTRQAVSKWESDNTFPETEKLILLSKLFNCSIDYLLSNNTTETECEINTKVNNKTTIQKIFPTLWSSLFFYVTLLLYILPFATIDNNFIRFIEVEKNTLNIYDCIFSDRYDAGNVLILFGFICQLIMLVLGIILVKYKKEVLFKFRYFFAIIELVIWIVVFALELYSFQIGMALMILLSLSNLLGLSFIKFNKFPLMKEETEKAYKPILPIVIASLLFILFVFSCFVSAVDLGPYVDLGTKIISIIELIYSSVAPPILIILSIIGITFEICVFILAIFICIKKKKIFYVLYQRVLKN